VLSDSGFPRKSATATISICISDKNDECMYDRDKGINVFNYCSNRPDTMIGYFFVEDKDLKDTNKKTFSLNPVVISSPILANAKSYFQWILLVK
jgi:hypothetical protein